MEVQIDPSPLLTQAATIFQKAMGHGAALCAPVVLKNWSRSLVVRCRVESADAGISSLIIKQIKADAGCGFSDWASLAFLSELPEAQNITPRFYGGDVSARTFLMEDLGEAQSLQDILTGGNPATVRTAVRSLAVQMASLHAATQGQQEHFDSIRADLPEGHSPGRVNEARTWLDNREKLLAWFKAVGYDPPSSFQTCLSQIAEVYREPDGFPGFTHGDPAPTNNHFKAGQARLLDFEYGGFRHVLYDITAWNTLCPLPADYVHEMSECFRQELAKIYPAAHDEAHYAEAWAFLCAYRALAMLTWISPEVLKQNRPWVENWTAREAVLAAVTRLEGTTAPFGKLEPVHVAAGVLRKELHSRWTEFSSAEETLPPWPAFAKKLQ